MSLLMLGDEAVGLAALHAGISGAFSYPGTPATEIFEFIQSRSAEFPHVVARWSANEKVAYEEAMGMSMAGKRALVSMKHVGLNVAADPFMSSALTGARGGLVLAVADDPGMHSSQNEQDSRWYGAFAQLPVFEPSDQQEAYDLTREAFECSERLGLPVMIRLVTRLAHSRSIVQPAAAREQVVVTTPWDWREWTLLPVNARKRFRRLLDLQDELEQQSETSPHNRLELRGPRGVIACGIAWNYVREALADRPMPSILKLSVYPPPAGLIRRILDHCEEVLIVEEGHPVVEQRIRGMLGLPGRCIRGKMSGALSLDGELTVDRVKAALAIPTNGRTRIAEVVPDRPPRLCDGCPHCDTFNALKAALEPGSAPMFMGDIGCYTLGALPPYNAVHSCVDMGASISMGIGAAKAGAHPVICTIGDSTFVHSGMTGLVGAAHENANMTVLILDNGTVAMTGGQEIMMTGDKLYRLVCALGVPEEHVARIEPTPKNHAKNVEAMKRAIAHRGLSVIIACRECIHTRGRDKQADQQDATVGATPAHEPGTTAGGRCAFAEGLTCN